MRLSKPTPAFAVATAALLVSLGGTSYAATQIGSNDIANNSIKSKDIKNGTIKKKDLRPGVTKKLTGPRGPAGAGRWLLVNANGQIEAQSGGFTIASAYPTLANTAVPPAASNALRANGNVYINAGEELSDNGVFAVVALQNQLDQNADGITNGRAGGEDNNPEFAGEISASVCGLTGVVACAPMGTNNTSHFVISPRNSDGTVTTADTRKRFYVTITGDSSDLG